MKKIVVLAAVVVFGSYIFGCGKKQSLEEQQEPMSMEALSTLSTTTQATPVTPELPKAPESKLQTRAVQSQSAGDVKLEPLPPAGPYKPTGLEIQTALKNASFYTGTVDGKVGSMTKKAVEAFQKANNLKADGKVGPKTWAALSPYLNTSTQPVTKKKKK
jgi:peptidoglycan hydrolase-like protein with peptidoglycan-binding domain